MLGFEWILAFIFGFSFKLLFKLRWPSANNRLGDFGSSKLDSLPSSGNISSNILSSISSFFDTFLIQLVRESSSAEHVSFEKLPFNTFSTDVVSFEAFSERFSIELLSLDALSLPFDFSARIDFNFSSIFSFMRFVLAAASMLYQSGLTFSIVFCILPSGEEFSQKSFGGKDSNFTIFVGFR